MPPPSVRPVMPVVEMMPPVVARPKACVAWLKSPHVAPAPACAVLLPGSTRTVRIGVMSMTSPSSLVPNPGALCPPSANGEVQSVVPSEVDAGDDVSYLLGAKHGQRTLVKHAVVHGARLVVTLVIGSYHAASYLLAQVPDLDSRYRPLDRSVCHVHFSLRSISPRLSPPPPREPPAPLRPETHPGTVPLAERPRSQDTRRLQTTPQTARSHRGCRTGLLGQRDGGAGPWSMPGRTARPAG